MKEMDFKGRKSGFTLAELLMVIAILVILIGLGVTGLLALRGNIQIAKYDDLAREIYVAVQNQLTRLEAGGMDDKMRTGLKMGTQISQKPEDYDKGDASWSAEKSNFFYADQSSAKVMELLLPLGAVAEDVRCNGFYGIEYNVKTNTVYSVFYSEQAIDYPGVAAGTFRTDRAARKASLVGYYGGSSVERDAPETCPTPELEIINENELRLNIGRVPTDTDLTVSVTVSDGMEGHEPVKILPTQMIDHVGQNSKTVLLDGMSTGAHFHERFPTLTPGRDLTVTVTYSKPGALAASASITTNSLFATREGGKQQTEGGVSKENAGDTVTIAWARHLQNLENQVSGLNDPDIRIARQTEHIRWNDGFDIPFTSIQNKDTNRNLLRYEGSGLEIRNLTGANGLFAETGENMVLSGIRLVNPEIEATGDSTQGVGALVGAANGSAIFSCGVYYRKINSSDHTVDYDAYRSCGITNHGTAFTGGLVGTATGVTVENSFAALPSIRGRGATLIGSAANCKIKDSYANCDNLPLDDFAYFIGGSGNNAVTHCYAVGNVGNDQEGVFADGSRNTVTDSYYAVSHRKFAHDPKDNQDLVATEFRYRNTGAWEKTNQEGMTKAALTGAWTGLIAPLSHPYREYLDGRPFPYPAIAELDHYGSWPDGDGTVEVTFLDSGGTRKYETMRFGKGIPGYLSYVPESGPVTAWSTEPNGKGILHFCKADGHSEKTVIFTENTQLYAVTGRVYNYNQQLWDDTLGAAVGRAASGDTLIVCRDTQEPKSIRVHKNLYVLSSGQRTVQWIDGAENDSGDGLQEEVTGELVGCMGIGDAKVAFGSSDIPAISMEGSTLTFDANRQSRVISLGNNAAFHLYDGVTLTGGRRTGPQGGTGKTEANRTGYGGGVYAGAGAVFYMHGGTISYCEAVSGGGVYLHAGSSMYMGDMVKPTAYSPAAVYYTIRQDDTLKENLYIHAGGVTQENYRQFYVAAGNPSICYNTATQQAESDGGGLRMLDLNNGELALFRGSITNNTTSGNGGGIMTDSASNNGFLQIYEVDISHNSAQGNGGGLCQRQGTVFICNSTIRQNRAFNGGGAYIDGSGARLRLEKGVLSDNTAQQNGGGVYSGGILELSGGTLSGNSAGNFGGGICCFDNASAMTMTGGTICNNRGRYLGGGILAGGPLSLSGGSLYGNTDTDYQENKADEDNLNPGPNDIYLMGDNVITIPTGGISLSGGERVAVDCEQDGSMRFPGTGLPHRFAVYADPGSFQAEDALLFTYRGTRSTAYSQEVGQKPDLKVVSHEDLTDRDIGLYFVEKTEGDGISSLVRFDFQFPGCQNPESKKYAVGDVLDLSVQTIVEVPEREGFYLAGWARTPEALEEQYVLYYDVAADIWRSGYVSGTGWTAESTVPQYIVQDDFSQTLYAMWRPCAAVYDLGPDAPGHGVSIQPVSVGPQVSLLNPEPLEYETGGQSFRFLHWVEKGAADGERYLPAQQLELTKNLRLIAVWEERKANDTDPAVQAEEKITVPEEGDAIGEQGESVPPSTQENPHPANSQTQDVDPLETEASVQENPAPNDVPAKPETEASGDEAVAQENAAPSEEKAVWTVTFCLDGAGFMKHSTLSGKELEDCQWDEKEKRLIYNVPAGEKLKLLPPEMEREGYILDGWLWKDGDEEILYPAGEEIPVAGSMELTPIWKKVEPTPPPVETTAPTDPPATEAVTPPAADPKQTETTPSAAEAKPADEATAPPETEAPTQSAAEAAPPPAQGEETVAPQEEIPAP